MSKYYRPNKEDFHIGFEYEWCHNSAIDSNDWQKSSITEKDFIGGHPFIQELQGFLDCRVKYLDRKDIEELGWEYIKTIHSVVDQFRFDGKTVDDGTVFYFVLSLGEEIVSDKEDDKVPYIWVDVMEEVEGISHYTQIYPIFHGIIKNKSELRKVMYQLKVLK